MKLNDEQIAIVKAWAAEGETLSGIQKRLKSELDLSFTYLDTRMLVVDLGLQLDEWKPKPKEDNPAEESDLPQPGALNPASTPAPQGVSVSADRITRVGALVSGRASFSDGKQISWHIDQQGRLGIDGGTPGYQPPAADIPVFQVLLDKELRKLGL